MSIMDTIADLFGVTAPSTLQLVFLGCAAFGALFFIVMMALMLVGDIFGGIVDSAFDTDFSMDSDLSFELFSLQGIAAAVMMFGLVGNFTLSATDMQVLAVFSGGIAAAMSMYMVKIMMQGISNLQADGTMKIRDAIGEHGTVYSRIRPNETGEIQIAVDGTLRTLTAKAKDKTLLIPTGEFVEVVNVIGSTLIVIPMSEEE